MFFLSFLFFCSICHAYKSISCPIFIIYYTYIEVHMYLCFRSVNDKNHEWKGRSKRIIRPLTTFDTFLAGSIQKLFYYLFLFMKQMIRIYLINVTLEKEGKKKNNLSRSKCIESFQINFRSQGKIYSFYENLWWIFIGDIKM